MAAEMPTMLATSYGSALVDPNDWSAVKHFGGSNFNVFGEQEQAEARAAVLLGMRQAQFKPKEEANMAVPTRRLVKVIIVDPNENIPLDRCMLYSGEEKLTDLTNQELFFELDIKNILAKHNEFRVTVNDKSVKDRTEKLEPAKIRDLKMVVVDIAAF